MNLPAGTRIGAYEVTSLLGAGGMGGADGARDTRLGMPNAQCSIPNGGEPQWRMHLGLIDALRGLGP